MTVFRGRLSFSMYSFPQPTATHCMQVFMPDMYMRSSLDIDFCQGSPSQNNQEPFVALHVRSPDTNTTLLKSSLSLAKCKAINYIYTPQQHPPLSPSHLLHAHLESAQCDCCHSRTRFLMSLVPTAHERAAPRARTDRLHQGLVKGIRNWRSCVITPKHH